MNDPTTQSWYLTTAATLASAKIMQMGSWMLATLAIIAMLIAPQAKFIYHFTFVTVLWLCSMYLHLRVHLDYLLLQQLGLGQQSDSDFEKTLLHLYPRKKTLSYSPSQRCFHCLALWYKSLIIDSVLCLLSLVTIFSAL